MAKLKKKKEERYIVLYDESLDEVSRVKVRDSMSDTEALNHISEMQSSPKGHVYKIVYGKRGGYEMAFEFDAQTLLKAKGKTKKLRM